MELIHTVLDACTDVFIGLLALLTLFAVYVVPATIQKRTSSSRFSLPSMPPVGYIALSISSIICVVGLVNLILSSTLKSTKIGAFYEKDYFTEDYEATFYYDKTPIFCIATVEKTRDSDDNVVYEITNISLPYGEPVRLRYDNLYYPDKGYAPINIQREYEHFHDLELQRIATDTSYALLDHFVVFDTGEFCGSKDSDKFHFLDCPYAQSISPENYIYFPEDYAADLFGYEFCSACWNRY